MSFYLWCSLNLLMDVSIILRIFQCTLTRIVVKWYIEFPHGAYYNFGNLVMDFLNHFQLLFHCEMGNNLLTFLGIMNPCTSLIIFMSGYKDTKWSRLRFWMNLWLIGSLSPYCQRCIFFRSKHWRTRNINSSTAWPCVLTIKGSLSNLPQCVMV